MPNLADESVEQLRILIALVSLLIAGPASSEELVFQKWSGLIFDKYNPAGVLQSNSVISGHRLDVIIGIHPDHLPVDTVNGADLARLFVFIGPERRELASHHPRGTRTTVRSMAVQPIALLTTLRTLISIPHSVGFNTTGRPRFAPEAQP